MAYAHRQAKQVLTSGVNGDIADGPSDMVTPGSIAIWVSTGGCTVKHEDETLTTLAVGDIRKTITLGAGEELVFTPTINGTNAFYNRI